MVLSFGMFDWVDGRDTASTAELYDSRIELIKAAEAAGFSRYHMAEHHATTLGMAPSPSVFLAAVARETRHIRLGPLVYLLPLYEPLRLAYEISMLDHLSHGRLELGVGRGVSPFELGYHGVDHTQTKPVFLEALDTVLTALTSDELTAGGDLTPRYEHVPMHLHPLQQPYPPLWYATTVPESSAWAGRHGLHLMGLGTSADFRSCVAAYREAAAKVEPGTHRLNDHVVDPCIGMHRQIVVAPSDEEAMAIAAAGYDRFAYNFISLWHRHDQHHLDGRIDLEANHRSETMFIGSPASIIDKIERQRAEADLNYFALSFAWGNLSHAQSLQSIELFASEVMPAFQ